MTLKLVSQNDVLEAAIALMRLNGSTTTLDVKTRLRNDGFFATQEQVSSAMRALGGVYRWQCTMAGNHLIYLPSEKNAAADSMLAPVIVLLTVNKYETDAVVAEFGLTEEGKEFETIGGITYRKLRKHGGCRIVQTLSAMGAGGIGASQQRTRDAIDHWQPKAVIAVGIAFGMDETKQQIGNVLISRQQQDYELARVNKDGSVTPRGDKPSCTDSLLNRFGQTDAKYRTTSDDWPKVEPGLILCGQKLLDNIDYRKNLKKLYPEAIGGEMEGTGLYVSAVIKKVDWIVVKAICDWGHHKNDEMKEIWQKTAAKNAARVVKAALDLDKMYE